MSFVSNILGGVENALGPVGSALALGAGAYFGAPLLGDLIGGGAAAGGADVASLTADAGGVVGQSALDAATGGTAAAAGGAAGGGGGLLSSLGLGGSGMGLGSALSIGSGLYGLTQAQQLQKIAQQAASMQDPFGPYRAQYANALGALQANPSSVTSIPGYQAGLDATIRGQAAGGYGGSGNMMTALQQYGGNFYQQQLQNLMTESGASAAPSGGNTLVAGSTAASGLTSASLGSIGYGAMLPQLMALLTKAGG